MLADIKYPFGDFSPIVVRQNKKGLYFIKGAPDLTMDRRQLTIFLAGLQAMYDGEPNPEVIGLMFTLLHIRGHNEAYFGYDGEFSDTGRYNPE